jgi:putative CocE/NonD family hydrolase
MDDRKIEQEQRLKELSEKLEDSLRWIRPANHELEDVLETLVPMDDGTGLYTKIFFPRGSGPWPLTFQRSCYEVQIPQLDWMARQMALRGYASGYQMCRGTGASEGTWEPFVNERRDGADTLTWLCRQERINSIGLYGLSYLGFTQWMVADILPAKVKTMVISQAGVDRYHANYSNGMFRHDVYTAWAMMNAGRPVDPAVYPGCCLHRPQITVDEDLWKVRLDWYRDWISHTDSSDPYWNTGAWKDLKEAAAGIKVPLCMVGGWYDHHLEGMFYAYDRLSPGIRAKSRFVIGPWNHGLGNCVDPYPLPDSENAGPEAFCESFRWLDGILKGYPLPNTGLEAYIIGEGRWQNYPQWPPEGRGLNYFLAPGEGGLGSLREAAGAAGKTEYVYDPARRPVEAVGAESMLASPPERRGSRLQPPPAYREDVLSFISEPVLENIKLCGKSRVRLFVSTDVEDTAFAVKLMELFPNGESYNIRSGISSIAYRNNAPKRLGCQRGEIVELNIEFWPITWTIHKGSRLRLDIMSTLFPEFHVHPNTAEPWALARETRKARQIIHSGGPNPSVLCLTIRQDFQNSS